jgi:hypothetical protein
MKTSETVDIIGSALAKAQGELRNAAFDAVNPAFRNKYATLAAIIDTIRKPLATAGIAWVQSIAPREDGFVQVVTRLIHSSGQWLEMTGPAIPVDKHNAHGTVSATTYAKRVGLSTALGIGADEDDDGNGAAHSKPAPVVQSGVVEEAMARIAAANDAAALGEVGAGLAKLEVDEQSKKKLRAAFTARRKALEAA